MADDDPFFIVPAVQPDDEIATTTTPKRSASSAATTRVSPVVKPGPAGAPTSNSASTAPSTSASADFRAPLIEPVADSEPAARADRLVRIVKRTQRRTTRVIRHVDPWSVFRVTLLFHFVLYLTLLLTGVLLWNVANATGTVDNVERFMESFGWESFEFDGGEIFHQAWILGLFLVVGLTGVAVLAATTFNLITDLVGGIRVTVLEVEAERVPRAAAEAGRQTRLSRTRDRR